MYYMHTCFALLRSLCKASAITGAVRLLRMTVRWSFRLRRLMSFVLAYVQVAVDYAVAYTICFIGIYGLSFSEGNRHTSTRYFVSCQVGGDICRATPIERVVYGMGPQVRLRPTLRRCLRVCESEWNTFEGHTTTFPPSHVAVSIEWLLPDKTWHC